MVPGFYLDGEEGTLTLDKESLMTTLVRDVRTGDLFTLFTEWLNCRLRIIVSEATNIV